MRNIQPLAYPKGNERGFPTHDWRDLVKEDFLKKDDEIWPNSFDFDSLVKFLEAIGKRTATASLEKRIDELAQKVEAHDKLLREIFAPVETPTNGSYEEWISNSELTRNYQGMHVAYLRGKGVVESAESLDELWLRVQKKFDPSIMSLGWVPKFVQSD